MKLLCLLFTSLFIVGVSYSQSTNEERNSEITVSAEATVSAEPDIAEFHLAIISRKPLATEAFISYLKVYEALHSSLNKLIDSTKLETGNLSVTPHFSDKNPEANNT